MSYRVFFEVLSFRIRPAQGATPTLSAIFGLQFRDGRPVEPGALARMAERLRHRGPDGSGAWQEGSVGLGHGTLHTTPESLREHWPLASKDGDYVLVADARIDNRDELVRSLDLSRPVAEITDGDLILAAYQKWGRTAPEKLLGDFAFAIWDACRKRLFCARDPMGVRPFYYHRTGRLFVFASEIKGLFCLPQVPRELDEVQLAYFLDWFRSDRERTFYRGVRRLPAAHFLEVGATGFRLERYWEADPEREIRYSTDEQYVEGFLEHFTEAVRCRLRSAFPVGSALSGGLDSSSIICVARDLLEADTPLHVVSATFPGLPEPYREMNDESRFIDPVAARDGVVSHRVRADELSTLAYFDRMFWYHDVPPFGFMYWMRWAVYEAAHEQGVRVFFSGDDGDTVVSHGYQLFNDLAREGRWQVAFAELEALSRHGQSSLEGLSDAYLKPRLASLARARRWSRWREGSSAFAERFDGSTLKIMGRSAWDAFVPDRVIAASRRLRGKRASSSVVSNDFARRIQLEERKRALTGNHMDPIPTARQAHAEVLPSSMLQHIMEVTDAMGSAFGIETRCPFLDRRLVEYSLAIPTEQKLAEGWTRLVLRKAMEGILPPEIQWRNDKGDLAYNVVFRLRDQDRETLRATLFDEPSVLAPYVDMPELSRIHRRFDAPGLRHARNDAARLYIAAVLALWLRGRDRDSATEPPAQV